MVNGRRNGNRSARTDSTADDIETMSRLSLLLRNRWAGDEGNGERLRGRGVRSGNSSRSTANSLAKINAMAATGGGVAFTVSMATKQLHRHREWYHSLPYCAGNFREISVGHVMAYAGAAINEIKPSGEITAQLLQSEGNTRPARCLIRYRMDIAMATLPRRPAARAAHQYSLESVNQVYRPEPASPQ